MKHKQGFTLIEILIVIGLIAVLAGVLVVALNPARQFAQARNAQRYNNVDTIMGSVINNVTDNRGVFTCDADGDGTVEMSGDDAIPAVAANMADDGYDIGPCLTPVYASQLPVDPSATDAHWTDSTDYDTGYTIALGADGRITIAAPSAELGETISLTR